MYSYEISTIFDKLHLDGIDPIYNFSENHTPDNPLKKITWLENGKTKCFNSLWTGKGLPIYFFNENFEDDNGILSFMLGAKFFTNILNYHLNKHRINDLNGLDVERIEMACLLNKNLTDFHRGLILNNTKKLFKKPELLIQEFLLYKRIDEKYYQISIHKNKSYYCCYIFFTFDDSEIFKECYSRIETKNFNELIKFINQSLFDLFGIKTETLESESEELNKLFSNFSKPYFPELANLTITDSFNEISKRSRHIKELNQKLMKINDCLTKMANIDKSLLIIHKNNKKLAEQILKQELEYFENLLINHQQLNDNYIQEKVKLVS